MFENFDTFQKIGKDNVDVALKSFGAASKGFQAIATEFADFQKKSFEEGTAAFEKLLGAETLDKAMEAQTEYYKTAYEGFVFQGDENRRVVCRYRQGKLQTARGRLREGDEQVISFQTEFPQEKSPADRPGFLITAECAGIY